MAVEWVRTGFHIRTDRGAWQARNVVVHRGLRRPGGAVVRGLRAG